MSHHDRTIRHTLTSLIKDYPIGNTGWTLVPVGPQSGHLLRHEWALQRTSSDGSTMIDSREVRRIIFDQRDCPTCGQRQFPCNVEADAFGESVGHDIVDLPDQVGEVAGHLISYLTAMGVA